MSTANLNNAGKNRSRGRTPYSVQACNVCRTRRTRCDGQRPVCKPCEAYDRQDMCAWSLPVSSRRKPKIQSSKLNATERQSGNGSWLDGVKPHESGVDDGRTDEEGRKEIATPLSSCNEEALS